MTVDAIDLTDVSHTATRWAAGTNGWSTRTEEFVAQIRRLTDLPAMPVIGDRVPYEWLYADEREALHAWVDAHGITHTRVPIDALVELDEATGEWRIEVHALRNGRPYVEGEGDDAVAVRRVVRRVSRGPLPWPTFTAAGSEADRG